MNKNRSSGLALADDLVLAPDAATHKIAFLGLSGSGKTYAAGKFVEELWAADAQVVIIDTVGNWYGLRIAADGKSPGLAIPVMGGAHGDIPLEPTGGALVADLIADRRVSLVLDVSDFTEGEKRKFVTAFAIQLLAKKKRAPSPVMVVWEECHECIPQRVDAATAGMVGAVERLVKRGRNYGIGTTLVSQQPQAVNKAVLNQVQLLFAFQTGGKHERAAIEGWVSANRADRGPLDRLAKLEVGQAIAWSPAWLRILKTIRISPKRTFDASATPDFRASAPIGKLAPVDLADLRARMAESIERATADDPKALRAQVAELRRQLAAKPTAMPAPPVEVPVLTAAQEKALHDSVMRAHEAAGVMKAAAEEVGRQLVRASLRQPPPPPQQLGTVTGRTSYATAGDANVPRSNAPRNQPSLAPDDRPRCSGPQQRMLDALAGFESLGLPVVLRNNLAVFSDQSPRSSGFEKNLSTLRTQGLISYPTGGSVALTDNGRDLASRANAPRNIAALHQAWIAKVSGPQGRMLTRLLQAYPSAITRAELAAATGQALRSSGYEKNLSTLRSLGVLDYPRHGEVAATALLYPDPAE